MKNVGTLGAAISAFLLLGSMLRSSLLAALSMKLIGLIVSLLISYGVYYLVLQSTQIPLIGIIAGFGAAFLLVGITGALL